ncbi:hypothetical protein [Rhodococcus sp. RDE2]|uniref:hypothetical protein n=1 Tax=Rhodococcus sp. RDE2 TaxID=2885078 RepID=UPI001E65A733|nr:hypothetical protein [Rhodococcus sp. RDE2]BDB63541.1 hypothetical protein RDE2_53350 [Rhodococcus sp. RDE2]
MTPVRPWQHHRAQPLGLLGEDVTAPRVSAPFTETHWDTLIEVANSCWPADVEGPLTGDLHEGWVAESLTLDEDGTLVWDAGVERLTLVAVNGIGGMYVQVLTGPAPTAEADWPISLECPRETARTLWHLIGLFSI